MIFPSVSTVVFDVIHGVMEFTVALLVLLESAVWVFGNTVSVIVGLFETVSVVLV
jgi:hypothetical protein